MKSSLIIKQLIHNLMLSFIQGQFQAHIAFQLNLVKHFKRHSRIHLQIV